MIIPIDLTVISQRENAIAELPKLRTYVEAIRRHGELFHCEVPNSSD